MEARKRRQRAARRRWRCGGLGPRGAGGGTEEERGGGGERTEQGSVEEEEAAGCGVEEPAASSLERGREKVNGS